MSAVSARRAGLGVMGPGCDTWPACSWLAVSWCIRFTQPRSAQTSQPRWCRMSCCGRESRNPPSRCASWCRWPVRPPCSAVATSARSRRPGGAGTCWSTCRQRLRRSGWQAMRARPQPRDHCRHQAPHWKPCDGQQPHVNRDAHGHLVCPPPCGEAGEWRRGAPTRADEVPVPPRPAVFRGLPARRGPCLASSGSSLGRGPAAHRSSAPTAGGTRLVLALVRSPAVC
jgi:hypothetical protein